MVLEELKIFYSWQSDLPGNSTRYLIQESIQFVVDAMKDVVEIDADRDTKGAFGSPDITQTIFSKIDESDIFIADVSIINKYYSMNVDGSKSKEIKTTPNPNVLIELGYAAKFLGWENIICVINTEYGEIEELPFDIRQRRLTPFSLSRDKRQKIKQELSSIIASTVMNVLNVGKRPKSGVSNHILGTYNCEHKQVQDILYPFAVTTSPNYINLLALMKQKSESLIKKISLIKLEAYIEEKPKHENNELPTNLTEDSDANSASFNALKLNIPNIDLFSVKESPCYVDEKKQSETRVKVRTYLNSELIEDFFNLGNLKKSVSPFPNNSTKYIGTECEKQKNDLICELESSLLELELLKMYIKTFDNCFYVPLAIHNISSVLDEDISIYITVDETSSDIVSPSGQLISDDIKGLEGIIYDTGFIKQLFLMLENSDIHYSEDITYSIEETLCQTQIFNFNIYGNSGPKYSIEDYSRELSKYIAKPIVENGNEFEFTIKSLKANEKSWLGPVILLKPKKDIINLNYAIKSNRSDGTINGVLYSDFNVKNT
ncbi:MAG TPA: hypothetical protein DIC60_05780 [Lachnospiraceae bacterium]|nr:hypothetical protein [Lachnospiraceae bacterium]